MEDGEIEIYTRHELQSQKDDELPNTTEISASISSTNEEVDTTKEQNQEDPANNRPEKQEDDPLQNSIQSKLSDYPLPTNQTITLDPLEPNS